MDRVTDPRALDDESRLSDLVENVGSPPEEPPGDALFHDVASLGIVALVHGVVPQDELLDSALHAANHLGSVLPETFALTKRELRQPVLKVVDEELGEHAVAVAQQWRQPQVRDTIREFLDATIGEGGG